MDTRTTIIVRGGGNPLEIFLQHGILQVAYSGSYFLGSEDQTLKLLATCHEWVQDYDIPMSSLIEAVRCAVRAGGQEDRDKIFANLEYCYAVFQVRCGRLYWDRSALGAIT